MTRQDDLERLVDALLTDEQIARACHEALEVAEGRMLPEHDLEQLVDELRQVRLMAAFWEAWETGRAAVMWTDGDLGWRLKGQLRAVQP